MHGRHEVGGRDRLRYVRGIGQFTLLFSLLGYGMAFQSEAAEWSLAPSLSVKGVYNSNLLLTPLPHRESYGYWVSPSTEFAGKTERLDVSSRMAADFVGYFGGPEVDKTFENVFVPISARYKLEKDILGFTGGFVRDNTLLGELQETGVALDFTQRNQWSANPTWTRSLTERWSLQMDGQFSYTTYDGSQARLVDYRLVGGSGGVLYQLTEQDQIRFTGSYSEFQTVNSFLRASFPGVSMGLTHAFSESSSGTIYGGPKFLSSTVEFGNSVEITSQDTVWVAGGRISKQFERATIQGSIARDLSPSGFGLIIATNRAEVASSYQLSETVTGSLSVVASIASGKSEAATGIVFRDRRYVSVRPGILWKVSEWWEAEVSYMYRWQDFDLSPTQNPATPHTAQSHAVTIMVTYSPPKLSFSH